MESKFNTGPRNHNWRLWLFGAIALLVCQVALAQPNSAIVHGIIPAAPGPYMRGQTIKIYGNNVYDLNNNNCDSIILIAIPSGTNYRFRSTRTDITFDYTGIDLGTGSIVDTAIFVIPCTVPDGNYNLYVFDDEDCDNGCTRFTASCGYSAATAITISGAVSPGALTYAGNQRYCTGEPNQLPTSSLGAGTYTDSPAPSILLSSTTGEIMIHNGWVGIPHTITFTNACGGVSTTVVRLKKMKSPSISYTSATYCANLGAIAAPTIDTSGAPVPLSAFGGSFTVLPPLIGFDSADGSVTFAPQTAPGTYLVSYIPNNDSCGNIATTSFQIINLESGVFDYNSFYCAGDAAGGYPASITSLAPLGGWFEEGAPFTGFLDVDSTTGKIDLDSTPAGTYTIVYTPATSGCATINQDIVVVQDPDSSSFTMPTQVCNTAGTALCTPTSAGPGLFYSGTPLLTVSTAGVIDLNNSFPGGPYTVYRTNGDPQCPDTTQHHIIIDAPTTAALSYASNSYCENEPDPAPVFQSGTTGGVFSISAGGVIDQNTGVIDLDSSAIDTFFTYYVPAGAISCLDTINFDTIIIKPAPNASFSLAPDSICQNAGLYPITTVPPSGGTDTWTISTQSGIVFAGGIVGTSINSNVLTPGGPFLVRRESNLNGCISVFDEFVRVMTEENADFVYDPDSLCKADQNPFPIILGTGGGTWVNFPNSNLNINVVTGYVDLDQSANGSHNIVHTTGGFCPEVDSMRIVILDAFDPEFYYPTSEFCLTASGTISPLGIDSVLLPPSEYYFVSVPNFNGLNDTTGVLTLGLDTAGTYNIIMELVNGTGACVANFAQSILVSDTNTISGTLDFPPDNLFCSSELIAVPQLLPNNLYPDGRFFSLQGNLAWYDRDSGKVSLTATPPSVSGYDIFFVLNNVCNDTIWYPQKLLLETPAPNSLFYMVGDSAVDEFCFGGSDFPRPILSGDSTGFFTYTPVNSADTLYFFNGDTTGVIDLLNSDAGFYTIHFGDTTGCTGSASADIRILTGPVNNAILLDPPGPYCAGQAVSIKVSPGERFNVIQFGQVSDTVRSMVTTQLANLDTIVATVEDAFGCRAQFSEVVVVNPIPDGIPISVPKTVSGSDSIRFQMGTNVPGTFFDWNLIGAGSVTFSNTQDTTDSINASATVPISVLATLSSDVTPGTAIFYFTPHARGCNGTIDTIEIKINPTNLDIFIPEVFTPNNDEYNATWKIQWKGTIDPSKYDMYVYNRNGGEVHYMDGLTSDWDGDDLPDGVYFYALFTKSGSLVDKGGLTIRRN